MTTKGRPSKKTSPGPRLIESLEVLVKALKDKDYARAEGYLNGHVPGATDPELADGVIPPSMGASIAGVIVRIRRYEGPVANAACTAVEYRLFQSEPDAEAFVRWNNYRHWRTRHEGVRPNPGLLADIIVVLGGLGNTR